MKTFALPAASRLKLIKTTPAIATGPRIDGTQEAFDADHPGDEKDATDLFAEQHAGDFGTER